MNGVSQGSSSYFHEVDYVTSDLVAFAPPQNTPLRGSLLLQLNLCGVRVHV